METPSIKVDLSVTAWSQAPSLGPLSTVLIRLNQKTEEFLIDERDGTVSSLGSYPFSSLPLPRISLDLPDPVSNNVYKHVLGLIHDRLLSQLVSDRILVESQRKDLPQGPLFMLLSLDLTYKSFTVGPSTTTSLPYNKNKNTNSASETCAICLEDISEPETETKSICQMPHCVHLFHERCLLNLVDGQNSTCPLCGQGVDNDVQLCNI